MSTLPPKNMNLYYNRASVDKKQRLNQTFDKFKVSANQSILGETLLRLEVYLQSCDFCLLPKDAESKALYKMYKYYDEITIKE